jgi:quercetin 2,3-dioxygenase
MILLHKAAERRRAGSAWLTFPAGTPGAGESVGFGVLEQLIERRLAPGQRIPQQAYQREIVTYVAEGALAYDDSVGRSGVVHAGEFQRIFADRRVRHSEKNASSTATARIFRMEVRVPAGPVDPRHEQTRFTAARRRHAPCLVASLDGGSGSLRLHRDVRVFSTILFAGRHVIHALGVERAAWLHVVSGQGTLHEIPLGPGDGIGVTLAPSISFTARDDAELLIIEVAAPPTAE